MRSPVVEAWSMGLLDSLPESLMPTGRHVSLPAYPFQRRHHWVKASAQTSTGDFVSPLGVQQTMDVGETLQTVSSALRALESAASVDERRRIFTQLVVESAAQVLGGSPLNISPKRPLKELGLDSMLATELRVQLSDLLDVALPAALLFNYPTCARLADFLDEFVFKAEVDPQSDTPSAPEVGGGNKMVSSENVSDESFEDFDETLAAFLEDVA